MDRQLASVSRIRSAFARSLAIVGLCCPAAPAKEFTFTNITDLPGGPGQGNAPEINDHGDITFYRGTDVFFFDRSAGTFLEVTALPGAPDQAWFPKLNNFGNILMINPSTRDLWLFERTTQAFTNLAALPGYPGNSQAHDLRHVFDINNANRICLHSGDLNFGDVYLYDHAMGTFENISDKPGGATHARTNVINNADQIAYMGFPDTYVYDRTTDTTVNITDLPGGPGAGFDAFSLNDRGDLAIYRPDELTFYEAASGSFLYLSTLPGFPAGSASSNTNALSDRGEITFWRSDIHYFDPADQSFTRLNDQGTIPSGGAASSINDFGEIALTAGLAGAEDIYLAVPAYPTVPALAPLPQLGLTLLIATIGAAVINRRRAARWGQSAFSH